MTDHPLLFNPAMAAGLLAGRKTQTRRTAAPRWKPGDRIWARERFISATYEVTHGDMIVLFSGTPISIQAADFCMTMDGAHQHRNGKYMPGLAEYAEGAFDGYKWRPGMHHPRWANRITLTVEEVREQSLHDITEADALAEGICWSDRWQSYLVPGLEHPNKDFPVLSRATAVGMYAALWDEINGSGEWLANPTVFATTFSVAQRNIDATD